MMLGAFSTEVVLDLAKISKAVYRGPLNQKHFLLQGNRFADQQYVHGSFRRGFCRVFTNDYAVVVAFRGTRERIDWSISNFRAWPVPLRDCGETSERVLVHRGFQNTLDYQDKSSGLPSLQALLNILGNMDLGGRALYITGHSLGGALAKLFAVKLRARHPSIVDNNLQGIVTFGSPAVGLRRFREYYGELGDITLRIVNSADAVPFSPPLGYFHVGKSIWLQDSNAIEDPGWASRLSRSIASSWPSAFVRHHNMSEYISALAALSSKEASMA
ncbi:lipase family protein [Pleomorphomonas sp. NRK KF1]|uniref:lipase family protein n=1 Tax=Pleomorphomonas sp. NRK KF1 TaxID=2943000 RepID=UPI002043F935|nr:lipase family protein [Pleomorphomonas sp. NRK KF1]MCM5553960.1 lipase family protein [Pleomorphomonas sp. NRK KF1]